MSDIVGCAVDHVVDGADLVAPFIDDVVPRELRRVLVGALVVHHDGPPVRA
ncbi:MAG: hypothetical protein R2705_18485 [Ilumatobacteraceae bacterium]